MGEFTPTLKGVLWMTHLPLFGESKCHKGRVNRGLPCESESEDGNGRLEVVEEVNLRCYRCAFIRHLGGFLNTLVVLVCHVERIGGRLNQFVFPLSIPIPKGLKLPWCLYTLASFMQG